MAVQPIRLFGDPVLRQRAVEVDDFDREVRQLVTDLTDTMLAAPGAGLAAPQIGVGLRVFTWNVHGEVGHLVNPSLELSDETQDGAEGCLSLPELTYDCLRALSVVATTRRSRCPTGTWWETTGSATSTVVLAPGVSPVSRTGATARPGSTVEVGRRVSGSSGPRSQTLA